MHTDNPFELAAEAAREIAARTGVDRHEIAVVIGSGSEAQRAEESKKLLTYGFLHGGLGHLFFNMLALFMFGAPLEQTWGEKRFLTYYLVCVIGAGLCQLLVTAWAGEYGPVLGASGGVFGLLLAYGMLFPNQRVMLLFPPIPMKARTFVIVFGLMELVLGFTGWQPGVAHFAHLGGMLFGWLLIRYWRGQPPFGKPKPPRPRIVR